VVSLYEFERRILSELEEAGEEPVTGMLNTVIEGTGWQGEVSMYQKALRNLVEADLVRMTIAQPVGRSEITSKQVSMDQIDTISSYLKFDDIAKLWRDSRCVGPPYTTPSPQIACTAKGKEEAFKILDDRGYQWWRPRK
jgi:hypothetical protein